MRVSGITSALLGIASIVLNVEAFKSTRTSQSCATQYCATKVDYVKTSVATVHKTIKSVRTETPKASTYYLDKPKLTTTITKVYYTTSTAKGYETETVTSTKVVQSTSVKIVSSVVVITTNGPDVTLTAGASTIPTPAGFIAASEDPDNAPEKFTTLPVRKRAYNSKYATSVKCTKTIETIDISYTTKPTPKTTCTVYGKTVTKTVTSTKVAYATGHVVKTITASVISKVESTSTQTSTITSSTVSTITVPSATAYAACSPENIFRGPRGNVGPFLGGGINILVVATDAVDCCNQCQAHLSDGGAADCSGSYYLHDSDESSPASCILRISRTCNMNSFFVPLTTSDPIGIISNGPCGKWKLFGGLP